MNKKVVIIVIFLAVITLLLFIKLYYFNNDNIVVNIYANGAFVDKKKIRCTNAICSIKLPKASRIDGTVLGYSTNKDDHDVIYDNNSDIVVTKSMDLYVISYNKYTVHIDDKDIDYLSKNDLECYAYNESKNCIVTLPVFNKVGYEVRGYSFTKDSITGYYYSNRDITIDKDYYLYPIYNTLMHSEVLNIKKHYYKNYIIEVENKCNNNQAKELMNYIDNISKNAKFLVSNSKITLLEDDTFNRIWGNNYGGKTYGTIIDKALDVRCSTIINSDYYATIVHELGHVWDFNYNFKHNGSISEQNDIINLYNKYRNMDNRPLREYSYTDIHEFVADMVRYYYFKYIVNDSKYRDVYLPSDMKNIIEKYIEMS